MYIDIYYTMHSSTRQYEFCTPRTRCDQPANNTPLMNIHAGWPTRAIGPSSSSRRPAPPATNEHKSRFTGLSSPNG